MIGDLLTGVDAVLAKEGMSKGDFESFKRDQASKLQKIQTTFDQQMIRDYLDTKTKQEHMNRDLMLHSQRCRETLATMKSEIKLEMSIERSRQKDSLASLKMKIEALNNKFDSEAANCLAYIQKIRQETMYTIVGYLFTSVAAFLGFLRLMKN